MKNLHTICKKVIAITDAEFDAAEAEARQQAGYVHPLKMATASRVTEAGKHNLLVIAKLRELRAAILS